MVRLFSLQKKDKLLTVDRVLEQHVARLFGKGLEVPCGPSICRAHAQDLSALHRGERFFCFQNGQRAIEPAGV